MLRGKARLAAQFLSIFPFISSGPAALLGLTRTFHSLEIKIDTKIVIISVINVIINYHRMMHLKIDHKRIH